MRGCQDRTQFLAKRQACKKRKGVNCESFICVYVPLHLFFHFFLFIFDICIKAERMPYIFDSPHL